MINLALSFILVFMTGFLFIHFLLKKIFFPYPRFLAVILAGPAGFLFASLLLFWSYVLSPINAAGIASLAFLGSVALLTVLYCRHPDISLPVSKPALWIYFFPFANHDSKLSWRTPEFWRCLFLFLFRILLLGLFFYALGIFLRLFLLSMLNNFYGGWDVKFIWHVKAKFFFRDPEQWQGMFSPVFNWTHPEYPLLIPAVVAWGWHWAGKELLIWPPMINGIFALAVPGLIFWYFLSKQRFMTAFLASSFFLLSGVFQFWMYEQYTDIPLCFFYTAAGLLLIQACRFRAVQFFFITGLMAGGALWTKNEGFVFAGWTTLLTGLLIVQRKLRSKAKSFSLSFLAGLSLPLGAFLYQKFMFTPRGEYWGAGHTLQDYFQMIFLDPQKTKIVFQGFAAYLFRNPDWNYLWWFFAAAILYRFWVNLRRRNFGNSQDIAGILTLMALAGYVTVLHISPYEIRMQIDTALIRLLLHASGLATVFAFETFEWVESSPKPASLKSSSAPFQTAHRP